jgi:hypothetical protein
MIIKLYFVLIFINIYAEYFKNNYLHVKIQPTAVIDTT